MRGNIITIEMSEKRGKMAKTIPLYQYDYGQKLIIINLELPTVYEVHFANEMYGEAVTMIGNSTGVDIPDQLLSTGKSIYLWLYLHDGISDGETEYCGVIPVIKRAEITDQIPPPHQQTVIEQAIDALNNATNDIEGKIGDAAIEVAGDIVAVQDDEPSSEYAEIWFPETPPESVQVPTWAEHQALAEEVSGKIDEPETEGTSGQVLATDGSGGRYWKTVSGGGGGTSDYNDLSNKPQIGGVTLSGNKSLSDLGAASATAVAEKYTKPQTGIPATDLASGVIPDVSGFYTKPQNGIPASDLASGVIPDVSGFYTKPAGGIPASDIASGVIPDVSGKMDEPSSDGTDGQVLATDGDGGRYWKTVSGGGGGTSDYSDLTNKPQINSVTLSGNKSLSDLGIASATDLSAKYEKPSGGIPATDIASGVIPVVTGFASKVTSPTENNFAALTSGGDLKDSGKKASDFLTSHQDITGKADKVTSATSGNFAALDSNGNLTDSGHKHSDYLTSHQSISGKADKVASATSGNFAALDSNGNLTDSGHKHSDYLTSHQDISGKVNGASSSENNHVATFDGTTGKTIKDSGYTIGKSVPSDAVFTDTTYESKTAASGGTAVSLVTTGEKYTWNNKGTYSKPSGGIPATDLASGVIPDVSGKIDKPSSPATGAFLVYNGTAWVAQSLSTWQGGNY